MSHLPKYYLANCYTDKGTFEKCIYRYDGYGKKYVYKRGSSIAIKIMQESLCSIIDVLTEEQAIKLIGPYINETLKKLTANGYSLEKMLKTVKHTKFVRVNYGLEHELLTFEDGSTLYTYSGKIMN